MKKKVRTDSDIIGRGVTDYLFNRRPEPTKKQASEIKRITARLADAALSDRRDVAHASDYETLNNLPNVLDTNSYYYGGEAITADRMTKENRFTPENFKVLSDITENCDKTLQAIDTFVKETDQLEDLPAVHHHLTNFATSATSLRTKAIAAHRQMELLNKTVD